MARTRRNTTRKRWLEPQRQAYMRAYHKEWIRKKRETDPEYDHRRYLRHRDVYNIRKKEKYHANKEFYRQQDRIRRGVILEPGPCEICGKVSKLCRDHNHATSMWRGKICANCNSAIGLIYESLDTLDRMKEYLLKWADA